MIGVKTTVVPLVLTRHGPGGWMETTARLGSANPARRPGRYVSMFTSSAGGRDTRPRVAGQPRRTRRDGERDPEDQGVRGGRGELNGDDVPRAD